jgi:hypothetical protein
VDGRSGRAHHILGLQKLVPALNNGKTLGGRMSGGSGGGGGGGGTFVPKKQARGGGSAAGEDRCNIRIQLPLSATDPANIKKISVGSVLDVALRRSRGTESVIAVIPTGRAYVDELIDCINEGFEYQATVQNLSATSVKVLVARK